MVIYSDTLTRADLDAVCAAMGIQLWDTDRESNDFHGARSRRFKTCIRPLQGEQGERWRKVTNDPFTGKQRRIFACSWDAHYVFIGALFLMDPNARVKSSLDNWQAATFFERAGDSGHRNWGSIMYPQYARYMCHDPLDDEQLREECFRLVQRVKPAVFHTLMAEQYGA